MDGSEVSMTMIVNKALIFDNIMEFPLKIINYIKNLSIFSPKFSDIKS